MARWFTVLAVGVLAFAAVILPSSALHDATAGTGYVSDFSGTPSSPKSLSPSGWDITAFAGPNFSMHTMLADHGPDCTPPPLTPPAPPPKPAPGGSVPAPTPASWQHSVSSVNDAVFQCNNHIMTSIFNGYAAVYMTPPAMMDFSQGPSVLQWNMSTVRTASRDWIDIVIMPFNENMQVNFQDNHIPNNAVHVQLAGGGNVLLADIVRGGYASPQWVGNCADSPQPATCHVAGNTYTQWDTILGAHGLSTSAQRRDQFQITLSTTHLTVGMPEYGFNWVDADINPPLKWNQGVVQLNHRGYNPEKSCEDPNYPQSQQLDSSGDVDNPWGATYCRPNTWHWGPVSIAPAAPFTIIPANVKMVSNATTRTVTFPQPAPAGSFFRGTGNPSPSYISFDNGRSYQQLPTVGTNNDSHPELGNSFWIPVPTGIQSVMLGGSDSGTIKWSIIDMALWAPTASAGTSSAPTATPTPTSRAATATPTSVPPTATRVPPTSTPVPGATPSPTPTQPKAGTSGSGTLGNTHIGSSVDSGDSGFMNGSRITTGSSAINAKSISVYVAGPLDAAPYNAYQVAIYTDVNGRPGTLVSRSGTGTLTANAWNTLPISGTLAANSSYWLVYNTNGRASHQNNMRQDVGNSSQGVYSLEVQFGTWPSNFGSPTLGNWKRSIYLNY